MQKLNVTVEITDGVDPALFVANANQMLNDWPLTVGRTGDIPGHQVEGEPYRAPVYGSPIQVFSIALATDSETASQTA